MKGLEKYLGDGLQGTDEKDARVQNDFLDFSIWVKEGRRYLSLKEETQGKALLGVF